MDDLARLFASADPAMLVVTAAAAGERAGCLVGFSTQCSIDPPRHLVCLSSRNRTYEVARRADALGVHFLSEDDGGLARLFGEETGDEVDKFSRCAWEEGTGGTPLLTACANRYVGRQVAWHEAGDHAAVVLDVADVVTTGGFRPLRFSRVEHLDPGHEP